MIISHEYLLTTWASAHVASNLESETNVTSTICKKYVKLVKLINVIKLGPIRRTVDVGGQQIRREARGGFECRAALVVSVVKFRTIKFQLFDFLDNIICQAIYGILRSS